MATAAIAVAGQMRLAGGRALPGWRSATAAVLPVRRSNTGPEQLRTQEVRAVTQTSPEEQGRPTQQALGEPAQVPSAKTAPRNGPATQGAAVSPATRVAAGPDRAAALAEQKQLAGLAARCLAGDTAAWEQLARTQHRRIYGICYRFTGSQSDAEDLTQEAFLKVWRNLASFDPAKGGFTTWLTTLTRNLLVDHYRRSRMERASDSLDETYDGEDDGPTKAEKLADTGRNQEQHVAGMQLRAQIQAALKQVSPELREAVILRDIEDMDYKDIAVALGVPTGTVKSRISRGRSELARLLQRIEGQVM